MSKSSSTNVDPPGTDAEPATPDGRNVAEEPTEVAQVTADGVVTTQMPEEAETDRFIGRVLANRYKITRRIGTGGFGAVFEAEDTKIRKRVAVKVLTRDLVVDSAILARFRKEAEAAGKVGHENIVDITDFDRTVDDHYFMVMEYLEGVDLGHLMRSGEQVAIPRLLGIMIQVCRGLHAAHGAGVVHRDLKPGNVYLTSRGSRPDFVKLLDFGISKVMEVGEEGARLTRTGQIIGTPLYMAPEQACGEDDVDHRADIYSLGVILYEAITGQPPFTAVNYLGIIAQHASDPPVPPSKQRPDLDIPPLLEKAILKAMAKRPEDRFSTAVELEATLVETLATLDPATAVTYSPDRTPPSLLLAQTGVSQRRREALRRPIQGIVLAALVIVAGVAVHFLWPRREAPRVETPPAVLADSRPVAVASPDRGPPPAPRQVVLRVTSSPPGAEVLDAEGTKLGRTPLEHRVEASDTPLVLVLMRRGYREARVELTPSEDREKQVVLKRRPRRGQLPDDPKGWGQR